MGLRIQIGVRIDNNLIEIAIQTWLSVCLTANDEKVYKVPIGSLPIMKLLR